MDASESDMSECDDALGSQIAVLPASDTQVATTEPANPLRSVALPLLRRSDWDENKRYDKNHAECIHYEFRWKISLRENVRPRPIVTGSALDIVLAPSDYLTAKFKKYLEDTLKDREKFPGETYKCEKKDITISIERTRGRGLSVSFGSQDVNWQMVDSHLEGLGTIFNKGEKMTKRITLLMEFVYKEIVSDPAAAKGQKRKRKNDNEATKAEIAKDASLWRRVYNYWRCRARYCNKGPHCWPGERGIHHRLEYTRLADIKDHHFSNMQPGEQMEDVDISVIPPHILRDVLQASHNKDNQGVIESQRAASRCEHACTASATSDESSLHVQGDTAQRLEEYCNWVVAQTKSDRWRQELQKATRVALEQCYELNSVLEHPKPILELMVKRGVKSGSALQFVSKPSINQWWSEQLDQDDMCT